MSEEDEVVVKGKSYILSMISFSPFSLQPLGSEVHLLLV